MIQPTGPYKKGSEAKFVQLTKMNESQPAPRIPAGFVTRKTAMPQHLQSGHTWAKSALSGLFSETA